MGNISEKNKVVTKKKGRVVSKKLDKTVVVLVETFKTHPKYHKKYISSKKYGVHDAENKCKEGDIVEIIPSKPISKNKKYKIV